MVSITWDNEFLGNFLRTKITRDFLGYIYQFPDKEELSEFNFSEVVETVLPPEKYMRGYLKFKVNFNAF